MSGFQITITDAGRAALINAQNNGTTAFVLSEIGVSTQHIGAGLAGLTVLPNEQKRLATMAGDVVADDTLHVTIRDEGADAYSLRTFGLYTSAGVLFAVYSQPEPILEKSSAAMLLLAVDARLVALDTGMVEFGPVGFTIPPASETVAGVVELATDAEVDAGVDPWRVITVRTLKRALGALSDFALKVHQHDAADTTSGVFNVGRIPALGMEKITGLATALAGKAASAHTHAINEITGLADALLGKAAAVHQHAADDIVSGVLAVSRIPVLGIEKITGLATELAGKAAIVHQHAADDIVSGVLAVGRIPALGMEKITGLAIELASKASLAGSVFTGAVRVRSGAQGFVELNSGSAFRPGLVAFYTPDNTRRGYMGFASTDEGGELVLQAETGWTWRFSNRPKFGTATPWDTANFDPAGKVNKAGDVMTGPLTIPEIRLKATGTGSGGTYAALISKYYGDDNYGVGFVGWRGGIGWTEVGSIDHNGRFLANGHRVWTAEILNPATAADASAGAAVDRFITPAALWSFAKSIGPSGYAQIPGTPLMLQWGSTNSSISEGSIAALLPVAFGGGCLFACAVPRNANGEGWADYMMQVVGRYLDRIVFFAQRANAASGNMSGYEWLALGRVSGTPDPVYSAGGGTGGGGGGGGGGGELNPEV